MSDIDNTPDLTEAEAAAIADDTPAPVAGSAPTPPRCAAGAHETARQPTGESARRATCQLLSAALCVSTLTVPSADAQASCRPYSCGAHARPCTLAPCPS